MASVTDTVFDRLVEMDKRDMEDLDPADPSIPPIEIISTSGGEVQA